MEKKKKSTLFTRLFGNRNKVTDFMTEEQLQSPGRLILKNFLHNRLGMTGLIVFLLIFLLVMALNGAQVARARLIDLLRRPQMTYDELMTFDPTAPRLPKAVREQVEISVKYEGYIRRQLSQVEEFEKLEQHALPADMDYSGIQGLRLEAREKLAAVRPLNLGQAGRISGVTPAALACLEIELKKRGLLRTDNNR